MHKKELCIVDRIEGDWVVIEYGRKTFNFPRELLPADAKEGDVLKLSINIDKKETQTERNEIENLTKDMFVDK